MYVDDLIIIGSAINLIEEIIRKPSQEFEMKDLGQMHYCFSIDIWIQDGKTLITQSKYKKDLIKRFNMNKCHPVFTPSEQNVKL